MPIATETDLFPIEIRQVFSQRFAERCLIFGVHTGAHGAENGLVAVDRGTMDLVVTVDTVALGATRVDATNWLLAKANPTWWRSWLPRIPFCRRHQRSPEETCTSFSRHVGTRDTGGAGTQGGRKSAGRGKGWAGEGRLQERDKPVEFVRGNAGDVDLCPAHCRSWG